MTVYDHPRIGMGVILENNGEYHKCYHDMLNFEGTSLADIIMLFVNENYPAAQKEIHYDTSKKILANIKNGEFEQLLDNYNNLFKMFAKDYKEEARPAKLKYLKDEFKKLPVNNKYIKEHRLCLLDRFLIKFNYHKIFLAKHPNIKTIKLNSELATKCKKSSLRFYDANNKENIIDFYKNQIIKPVHGKTYVLDSSAMGTPLVKFKYNQTDSEKLFNFYEKNAARDT